MTHDLIPGTTRRGFLRLAGAMGAAAALTGSLAACGTTPAQRQTTGTGTEGTAGPAAANEQGTITAGISYELGTNGYDPMTTTAALTLAANWHTMEGLTEILPSGEREVYPALASALPTQVDDTTWEATLRDGAVLHDGTPVTPDDVVFSFNRVMDEANNSLYRQFITFISSVEASGDNAVRINLAYPFSLVAERLAVVKIVPRAAVEAGAEAFDANPVGTGPWRMTDNSATSREIVFERFDDYTGTRPARAARMVWSIMPDNATRMNALSSGSVQAMDLVPELSIPTLQDSATVASEQGFGLLFAMFNNGRAPFDDVRNRQAFLYAIDMDKVVQTAYQGNATPATSFLQETHPSYHEASTVYAFNADRARELLAETGLTSFRMMCTNHGWVQLATPIIRESLEAVGLSVEFDERQSSEAYNAITGAENLDAYDVLVAPGDPSVFGSDADLLLRWWYAGDTWTEARMHWKGSDSYNRVQTLLEEGSRQTGAEQEATWGEIFDLLSEEVPLYPLFHRKTTTGYDDATLVDFQPIALTGLSFVDVGTTNA